MKTHLAPLYEHAIHKYCSQKSLKKNIYGLNILNGVLHTLFNSDMLCEEVRM